MNIFLVRHGQSEANVSGILCGQLDSPLTDLGKKQALKVGSILKNQTFSSIYVSPLRRALETAKAIADEGQLQIVPELKEHHTGTYSHYPKTQYINEIDDRMSNQHLYIEVPFEGGESLNQLRDRSFGWFKLNVLKRSNLNKNFLIVAHNGSLNGLMHGVFNISMNHFRAFELENAKYSHLKMRYDESLGWTANLLLLNKDS
jgi:broad specificity phosphatase PhoE